jgi:hypothetical protein
VIVKNFCFVNVASEADSVNLQGFDLIFSEPMRGMSMVKPGVLVSFLDGYEFPALLPIGSLSLQELCELFPADCAQHSFPCIQVAKLFEQIKKLKNTFAIIDEEGCMFIF